MAHAIIALTRRASDVTDSSNGAVLDLPGARSEVISDLKCAISVSMLFALSAPSSSG